MKYVCCAALLLAGYAQAGELLPMTGEEDDDMQDALIDFVEETVTALPDGVVVEPILESIDHSGFFKRITLGPLAGSSHVVLRIRITDTDGKVTEEVFSDEAGAWRGTFQPRIDSSMIEGVAEHVAEFIALRFNSQLPKD